MSPILDSTDEVTANSHGTRARRRSLRSVLALSVIAVFGCGHAAVPAASQAAPPVPEGIDARAARFIADTHTSGMAVAVVRPRAAKVSGISDKSGRFEVSIRGYGKAFDDGRAPDAQTLFEIASVSKVFTSLTLAAMIANKEAALDEPVSALLPSSVKVPARGAKQITLRSLATQSSGLPRMPSNFAPADMANPYVDYDAAKLYAFLGTASLASDPGERYEYSNVGMGLLGHALSLRGKQPLPSLINARVFAPLGMTHTFMGAIPRGEALADGHSADGKKVPPWDLDVLAGAGGVRSDAADMARFVVANLDPPAGLRTPIELAEQAHGMRPGGKVGLAWHIGLDVMTPEVRWHNGESSGFHSFIAVDRDKGCGVVVLANSATSEVDDFGVELLHALRGDPPPPPAMKLPAEKRDRYTGSFALAPTFVIAVTHEGDDLIAQATGQGKLHLEPVSETTFRVREVDATIDFEMGADGRAQRIVLNQGGNHSPGDRVAK